MDRLMLGPGVPYAPDSGLRGEAYEMAHSQRARRRRAWEVVARVVAPVQLSHGGELPRMQTWYGPEEVLLTFDHLLRGLSPAELHAGAHFAPGAVAAGLAWQATAAPGLPGYSAGRHAERLGHLGDPAWRAGLGGIGRTRLAPATVERLLASYASIAGCLQGQGACIPDGFPDAAASVKLHFVEQRALPRYDTTAAGLRHAVDRGRWEPDSIAAAPDARQIYAARQGADDWVLAAMHIATKELPDWLWVTLWWSDQPDSDFGADRPASLGPPWDHYKMCVVSDYDEGDGDPRGGFADDLGDALAVVHGERSWCSNPYLESGAGNVLSNCMGCHQHGGSGQSVDAILGRGDARGRQRSTFLSDYLWALDAGVELAQGMRNQVEGLSAGN